MRLYADLPARRFGQLLGDLAVLVLVYLAARLGIAAHSRVAALAGPGRNAEGAARRLQGQLHGAAGDIHSAPLVGGALAKPFQALSGASRALAGEAQSYQDAVAHLALFTGVLVAVVPVLVLLVAWLPKRVGWVVEASAAQRLVRGGPAAADLLAVRALARQPLRRLAALGPDVVAGWKAGDPAAAEALARLELEELGLRPWARPPATAALDGP